MAKHNWKPACGSDTQQKGLREHPEELLSCVKRRLSGATIKYPTEVRGKTKKSVLITLTVDPEVLTAFDGIVEAEGVSRASGIKILLKRVVAKGTLF